MMLVWKFLVTQAVQAKCQQVSENVLAVGNVSMERARELLRSHRLDVQACLRTELKRRVDELRITLASVTSTPSKPSKHSTSMQSKSVLSEGGEWSKNSIDISHRQETVPSHKKGDAPKYSETAAVEDAQDMAVWEDRNNDITLQQDDATRPKHDFITVSTSTNTSARHQQAVISGEVQFDHKAELGKLTLDNCGVDEDVAALLLRQSNGDMNEAVRIAQEAMDTLTAAQFYLRSVCLAVFAAWWTHTRTKQKQSCAVQMSRETRGLRALAAYFDRWDVFRRARVGLRAAEMCVCERHLQHTMSAILNAWYAHVRRVVKAAFLQVRSLERMTLDCMSRALAPWKAYTRYKQQLRWNGQSISDKTRLSHAQTALSAWLSIIEQNALCRAYAMKVSEACICRMFHAWWSLRVLSKLCKAYWHKLTGATKAHVYAQWVNGAVRCVLKKSLLQRVDAIRAVRAVERMRRHIRAWAQRTRYARSERLARAGAEGHRRILLRLVIEEWWAVLEERKEQFVITRMCAEEVMGADMARIALERCAVICTRAVVILSHVPVPLRLLLAHAMKIIFFLCRECAQIAM